MGGGLPTGGQGSKVYVLCAEPKEHKRFRPGTRSGGFGFPAGRIGDRGDREIVYVPNVYVPFPAPNSGRGLDLAIRHNYAQGIVFVMLSCGRGDTILPEVGLREARGCYRGHSAQTCQKKKKPCEALLLARFFLG